MSRDLSHLPDWPLLLSEAQAAAYLSLPVTAFLRSVSQAVLPGPRLIAGHRRWSRLDLDRALHPAAVPAPCGQDPLLAAIEQWSAG